MATRILIADDHGILREAVASMLGKELGMEMVGEAENGRKAVQLAQELKPDIILMDVEMPGLNGIETLRELWKMGQTVPIYIVTAFYDEYLGELQSAANDGVSFQLLRKPVSAHDIRAIAKVISEYEIRFSG